MARTPYDDPEAEKQYSDTNTGNKKLAGSVSVLTPNYGPESDTKTGPTPDAADYATGRRTDPKILTIGNKTLTDWLERMRNKR